MLAVTVPKYVNGKGEGFKRKLNPDFIALWEPYLEEGMPLKYVAEMFGVAERSVARHYPDKAWTRKQILEHSHAVKALNKV